VGLAWYRDGNDSVAFHRDTDLRYCENTVIAILTLGAQRPWLLQPRGSADRFRADYGGKAVDLSPAGGDLVVLGGRAETNLLAQGAEGPGGAGGIGASAAARRGTRDASLRSGGGLRRPACPNARPTRGRPGATRGVKAQIRRPGRSIAVARALEGRRSRPHRGQAQIRRPGRSIAVARALEGRRSQP